MPLPKMKQPDFELHTYPPAGFIDKKEARDGVSWADLGSSRGKTAWDVIFFNFRTFVPEEVNWYMWHYLGRTKLASDGINLTFGADPFNPSAVAEPPKRSGPATNRGCTSLRPASRRPPPMTKCSGPTSKLYSVNQQLIFNSALPEPLCLPARFGVSETSSHNGGLRYSTIHLSQVLPNTSIPTTQSMATH